ncbi:hypothetical protein BGZ70_006170 [Mortierella alpina]|uniref:EF-hand domain-containing protein n=1 Tax=Mortierella alpina TaxID=64518 RepID=A0A9P6M440_MORAP|nr:hypothetical protein BGZ70_006170 [Mortierella alpina]
MLAKSHHPVLSALALLAITATVLAGTGLPADTDSEHSNYGDMKKAKEFAKEYMGDKAKTLSEREELMTLFSMHDSNKDGHLDGIELREAFSDYNNGGEGSKLTLQQMNSMIDHVIDEDDTNNE